MDWKLLRDYLKIDIEELEIQYFEEKNEKQEPKKKDVDQMLFYWPETEFPLTKYSGKDGYSTKDKLEKILSREIKPKSLALYLTSLDLELIKNLTVKDLVQYDGRKIPQNIRYLLNKNIGILNWMADTKKGEYLLKLAKYSEELKNYNLLNIVVRAMQTRQLTNDEFSQIIGYKEYIDNPSPGIFPIEWILNDCANSNRNENSELCSVRFCKIVEKLKEMKLLEYPYLLDDKKRHYIYSMAWNHLNKGITREGLKRKEGKYYSMIHHV